MKKKLNKKQKKSIVILWILTFLVGFVFGMREEALPYIAGMFWTTFIYFVLDKVGVKLQ